MNYCSVWLIVAWFWWGEFENYLMLLTMPNKNLYSFSLKKSQCAIEPISSHLQSTEGSAILSTLAEQRWWTNSGPSDPRWVRSHLKPLVQVLLKTHSRAHPLPHYHCHTPTTTHTYPFTSTAKGTEKNWKIFSHATPMHMTREGNHSIPDLLSPDASFSEPNLTLFSTLIPLSLAFQVVYFLSF